MEDWQKKGFHQRDHQQLDHLTAQIVCGVRTRTEQRRRVADMSDDLLARLADFLRDSRYFTTIDRTRLLIDVEAQIKRRSRARRK